MEWIVFDFYFYLICIEIGFFKNFKECARSPCNGNHFSSKYICRSVCLSCPKMRRRNYVRACSRSVFGR